MNSSVEQKKSLLMQRISYIFLLSLLTLIFIASGIMKFSNSDAIVSAYSKWNLLAWKEVIGISEIVAVILFLIPKTNFFGALLLSILMIGATYIHAIHAEPYYFPVAIILVIWINHLFIKPKITN